MASKKKPSKSEDVPLDELITITKAVEIVFAGSPRFQASYIDRARCARGHDKLPSTICGDKGMFVTLRDFILWCLYNRFAIHDSQRDRVGGNCQNTRRPELDSELFKMKDVWDLMDATVHVFGNIHEFEVPRIPQHRLLRYDWPIDNYDAYQNREILKVGYENLLSEKDFCLIHTQEFVDAREAADAGKIDTIPITRNTDHTRDIVPKSYLAWVHGQGFTLPKPLRPLLTASPISDSHAEGASEEGELTEGNGPPPSLAAEDPSVMRAKWYETKGGALNLSVRKRIVTFREHHGKVTNQMSLMAMLVQEHPMPLSVGVALRGLYEEPTEENVKELSKRLADVVEQIRLKLSEALLPQDLLPKMFIGTEKPTTHLHLNLAGIDDPTHDVSVKTDISLDDTGDEGLSLHDTHEAGDLRKEIAQKEESENF